MQGKSNAAELSASVSRRTVVRLLAFGGLGALAAACAGVPPGGSGTPTSVGTRSAESPPTGVPAATALTNGTSSATAQVKTGGTLNWGRLGNLVTLDGHSSTNTDSLHHIWDRLIEIDENLTWVPRLAERWDINPDYTQIKLNLRKGVQFHTGRELTSDDVVWNLNRVKDPSVGGGIYAAIVAPLESVANPDKYTVVLNCKQPYPWVNHLLYTLNIVDPVTMQEPDGVNRPVGTGPFKFVEYVQGDHVTLTKNTAYWRAGLPYLDTLQVKIFADPQTQVTSIEAGAIDAAVNIPLRDAARLQNDPKYRLVVNKNSGATYVLQFNTTLPPADTKLVRQAVQYAIDRPRIANSVFFNLSAPQSLPWYPSSPAYDEVKNTSYAFDLDKARSLLQHAGLQNVQMDLNYSTAIAEMAQIAQIMQADLAKTGVQVTLKPTDPPALSALQYGVKYNGVAAGTSLYGQVLPGLYSASPYFGASNWAGFKSEELTQLTTAISTAVAPDQLKQAAAAYNDFILDESFTATICSLLPRVLTSARVEGVRYGTDYLLYATEASLA